MRLSQRGQFLNTIMMLVFSSMKHNEVICKEVVFSPSSSIKFLLLDVLEYRRMQKEMRINYGHQGKDVHYSSVKCNTQTWAQKKKEVFFH